MKQGVRYVVVGVYNTLFGIAVFVALDLTLAAHIGHYLVLTVATVIPRRWANSSCVSPRLWRKVRMFSASMGMLLGFRSIVKALPGPGATDMPPDMTEKRWNLHTGKSETRHECGTSLSW